MNIGAQVFGTKHEGKTKEQVKKEREETKKEVKKDGK
jgi:hypothetical protein